MSLKKTKRLNLFLVLSVYSCFHSFVWASIYLFISFYWFIIIIIITIRISKSQRILCLILQNGFWFVHISFRGVLKFQFLARLPVDQLLHPVISFTHWEFFISVLTNGFSLEFEWQQVSSSLQDSSQNSGPSQ